MGLVIDAILKIASVVMGALDSASRYPTASKWTTLPRRATRVTTPGTSPLSTYRCIAVRILASRSADIPTSTGFAIGRPDAGGEGLAVSVLWDKAGWTARRPNRNNAHRRTFRFLFLDVTAMWEPPKRMGFQA